MKTIKLFKGALLVAMSLLFVSCSDDDPVKPVEEKTIVEIVNTNSDFSILRAAIVRAGLVSTLQGEGTFTVFAPNNAAFQKAGFANESSIEAVPIETLKSILLYHTLGSVASASSLPTAVNTPVKTIEGTNVYVTKSSNGVFVNGAAVGTADVNAKNGIIHVIDNVLMPATGNIVEVLIDKPDFSFLVTAVIRASQGALNVKNALEGVGPFTVFAPNNQAFIAAGFATTQALEDADPATLTNILTGHVVEGLVFSNAIQNNMIATALGEQNITFSIGNAVTVKGTGNTTAANIVAVNELTTNGVIHVIDKVLLP